MHVRAHARDRGLDDVGCKLTEPVGDERPHEDLRATKDERRDGGEHEPQRAVRSRVRERFEDRIEDTGAVRGLPAFEVLVPADDGTRLGLRQTGTSAFARAEASLATPPEGRAGSAGAAVLNNRGGTD